MLTHLRYDIKLDNLPLFRVSRHLPNQRKLTQRAFLQTWNLYLPERMFEKCNVLIKESSMHIPAELVEATRAPRGFTHRRTSLPAVLQPPSLITMSERHFKVCYLFLF
jgi:hypothetical protein